MDRQDEKLISYLLGEASPEEIRQVEDWQKTDAACNRKLEAFRLILETSKHLADDQPEDVPAALHRFRLKATKNAQNKVHSRPSRQRLPWLYIAASIVLAIGAVWFYHLQHRTSEIRLTTQAETRSTVLSDGSAIVLNHKSIFECPSVFKGNERIVKLVSGEAFFNIAHNRAKPFIIHVGTTAIRVIGTSFNVKKIQEKVEVIVESGIVEVYKNNQATRLYTGERLIVQSSHHPFRKVSNTDHLYNYYRTKVFEAHDTPLWRIVEVLNEAYGTNIVIENRELMNLPLNTTFKNQSLDAILKIIGSTFNIEVQQKDGMILLK